MSSFLIVSPDRNLEEEILTKCSNTRSRLRQVFSIEHARRWISMGGGAMGSFRGVFIDQFFSTEEVISLFVESWSTDPETYCGILSKEKIKDAHRSALTLGVEDCCGPDYLELVSNLISRIPEKTTLTHGQHSAVLVVEDLDSPRDIICALVESLGFTDIASASSVDEAMTLLNESPFRYFAIITDLNMPERSGHILIEEVRESLPLAYLPIIVLTSDPSEENLIKSLKAGVTAFIAKPPKKQLLKAELEKARRLVLLGRSPELGTPEELRLLEKSLKDRRRREK